MCSLKFNKNQDEHYQTYTFKLTFKKSIFILGYRDHVRDGEEGGNLKIVPGL